MFQPKIPTMPQPSGLVTPPAVVQPTTITPGTPAPAPAAAPELSRPVVQLTPGTAVALVGAGIAVVLVVGTVLVSLLLAVAVTSASVAVCAVVLRSLIASNAKRR
ncbi:SpdD-like protein [Streptomyces sp. JV186]|uniref:SpdD-like protein n=1 Tax=Streptomyces TaxID=1883 RepID=UPI002E7A4715|nr:SpdD-like protein [Streptomyces sp. JV186]MEE1723548.1 SpdD-like protein [Streptomyces sp. JV186]WTB63992.1 SpdD-like protein [Streptomyces albidoflavus]